MTGLIGMVNRTNILKPSIFLAMFEQTKCQCKQDTDLEVAYVVWTYLPETYHIAPENGWLEYWRPFGKAYF